MLVTQERNFVWTVQQKEKGNDFTFKERDLMFLWKKWQQWQFVLSCIAAARDASVSNFV
jgi:hypothetical protein